MGFFEEDVGPDTISDFTTRVISDQLAQVTEAFCRKYNIEVFRPNPDAGFSLPRLVDKKGRSSFILLVPIDIVRELPMANDWGDIETAAYKNAQIRDRVNSFLGGIAKPTVADRKAALRNVALQSGEHFDLFLATVKEHVKSYDTNIDSLGYYKLKMIFSESFERFKQ